MLFDRKSAVCENSKYLSTELKVDHDDGDLRAGNDEDDEHKEQKSKHVVELVLPDGLHTSSISHYITLPLQFDSASLTHRQSLAIQIQVPPS